MVASLRAANYGPNGPVPQSVIWRFYVKTAGMAGTGLKHGSCTGSLRDGISVGFRGSLETASGERDLGVPGRPDHAPDFLAGPQKAPDLRVRESCVASSGKYGRRPTSVTVSGVIRQADDHSGPLPVRGWVPRACYRAGGAARGRGFFAGVGFWAQAGFAWRGLKNVTFRA